MAAIPLKPEYGPSLGRLLSPWWRRASLLVRVLVVGLAVGVVALGVAVALTLQDVHYSHRSTVAFHFTYKDLYRTAPDPGGYVKVDRLRDGRLADSFAVERLHLPAYRGELNGYLPLYATLYGNRLSQTFADFAPTGDGKTKVNSVPAYSINFRATVDGETMDGRDVLILPPSPGARDGVVLAMLTRPNRDIDAATPVGVCSCTGVLNRELESFYFGG